MLDPPATGLDCERQLREIRVAMVHGSGRYQAQRAYSTIRDAISTFRPCQGDLADYLLISLDFAFSKITADSAVQRCEALLDSKSTSSKVRVYCLMLKARLLIDIIPYEENSALRLEALTIAQGADFRVLAALIRVNAVLAALAKLDAQSAAGKLVEARSAVAELSDEELQDPDAFGVKARLRAHEAKVLIHEAAEGEQIPHSSIVNEVCEIYDGVCDEILEYDHLRANYRTELADELHRLARRGVPGALEASEFALAVAQASGDAHFCDLCRGYFHEISAAYHFIVAERWLEWIPHSALLEFERAKQAAASSLRFYTIAEHPSVKFAQENIDECERRISALKKPDRIFLSHRGADKGLVRRFHSALDSVNFRPWIDEEDMSAGTKLHRGLLQGMQDSCAAVFFITKDFVDEGYLSKEIDYAIEEERSRPDSFRIIALVFEDTEGRTGVVPSLLKPFVWKQPKSELEALVAIIKAQPLSVPVPCWRDIAH